MPDLRKRYNVWSPISREVPSLRWTGLVVDLPKASKKFHNFIAARVLGGREDQIFICKRQKDGVSYSWVEGFVEGVVRTEIFLDFGTREVAF